jgi:hypothetical protein
MSAIRLAVTAVSVAVTIAQHPVVRAGLRAVVAHPRTRETVLGVAHTAGAVARRIIPRALIR